MRYPIKYYLFQRWGNICLVLMVTPSLWGPVTWSDLILLAILSSKVWVQTVRVNLPYSGTCPVPLLSSRRTLRPPDLMSSIARAWVISLVVSPFISIIWSPTCKKQTNKIWLLSLYGKINLNKHSTECLASIQIFMFVKIDEHRTAVIIFRQLWIAPSLVLMIIWLSFIKDNYSVGSI